MQNSLLFKINNGKINFVRIRKIRIGWIPKKNQFAIEL